MVTDIPAPIDQPSASLTAEIVAVEADLRGPSPEAWFARLDLEADPLEQALGWSLEHDHEQGLRLAGAVWPYWLARGQLDSGRRWLAQLLAASEWGERTEARAKALYGAGTLAFIQGDREPSLRLHTESLAIARELQDQALEADALIGLARVAVLDSDGLIMEQRAQASLEAARAAGDQQRVATALHHVVEAVRRQGRYAEALPLYHQSLEAHRALGDERGVALEMHNLGNVARLTGDTVTADARLRESLQLAAQLKSVRLIGYCLLGLAHLAGERGDWHRAARLLGASAATFQRVGASLDPDYIGDREKTLTAAQAVLGADSCAAEVAAGGDLEQEAAVREGLSTD
ncbi:MAG: tetratricopeptide repeat protein [Candidatus Dormibacteraeota bacterium]|nr:tetratricopeptide repeat protein [Candidatus Dormibacteraeota bacterium]